MIVIYLRKKENQTKISHCLVETDKIVLDNVKIVLDVYANTIDDLKQEIAELKTKVGEYEKLVENMSEELHLLRTQIKSTKRTKVE